MSHADAADRASTARFARATTVSILAVALASCSVNQSGNLHATTLGDTSHPATRGSPLAELQAACGSGVLTPDGALTITREPYVQHVTSSSALIGWVTTNPGGARIELTRPDGTAVATQPGVLERASPRPGTSQLWANVDGLSPDTIYCYTLADHVPRTTRTGFRTAPTADSTRPVRFLAFGDSGGRDAADRLALREQMTTVPYELILHLGDAAYAHGTLDEYVFRVYAALLRSIPMFPVAGNHDVARDGARFRAAFALPAEPSYSFDWGRVHFVALDSHADHATQAAWLDRDLGATRLPWKIVYLHNPPYSSGRHGSDRMLRAALEPVLVKHGVQLVLSGHEHDYERTTPQHGVVYVVSGGGGRGTTPAGRSSFTALSEPVIHFVYVEVGVDQLILHAIDATGVEFDSVVVPRGTAGNAGDHVGVAYIGACSLL